MGRITQLILWGLAARALVTSELLSSELSELTELDGGAIKAKAHEIVATVEEPLAKALDEGALEDEAFGVATKALLRGIETETERR